MSRTLKTLAARTGGIALLAFAALRPAAAADDGYARYACRVDGISEACAPVLHDAALQRPHALPSPYAAYLIDLGVDRGEAVARARAAGEGPGTTVALDDAATRTSRQAYEEWEGRGPQLTALAPHRAVPAR